MIAIIFFLRINLITEEKITNDTISPTIQIQTRESHATTPKIRTETPLGQELDPEVDKYLLEVFKDAYSESLQIIRCESTYDFKAVSKTGDYCGFQINQIHFSEFPEGTYEEKVDWILNPINCINFAYKLYQANGWRDWGTPTSSWGSYWCWHIILK